MTDTEKAEYDDVVRQLMAKCEQLAAENARLRSLENNAHAVCKEIYGDPSVPPAIRLKAASIAIGHESAPLKPQPAPLDLVAEPVIPLADLVRERRAYYDRMLREQRNIKVLPNGQVLVLDGNGSTGSDD